MPIACLLVDRCGAPPWPGRGAPPPRRRATRGVQLGALAVIAAARAHPRSRSPMAGTCSTSRPHRPWHGGSFATNVATVARVWVKYLQLVLWPAALSVDYSYDGFPVSTSVADPRALASAAVLGDARAARVDELARGGRLGLGLAWMAVTLLPVSHLVPFRELIAEHYLYIPMMGVAIVASGMVDAAIATLAGAATRGWRRRWRSSSSRRSRRAPSSAIAIGATRITLWTATVAVVPRCARAQFNLGQAYFERSRSGRTPSGHGSPPPRSRPTIARRRAGSRRSTTGSASTTWRRRQIDEVLAAKPDDGEALSARGLHRSRRRPARRARIAFFDRALAVLPPAARKAEAVATRARAGRGRATPRRSSTAAGCSAPMSEMCGASTPATRRVAVAALAHGACGLWRRVPSWGAGRPRAPRPLCRLDAGRRLVAGAPAPPARDLHVRLRDRA